ncbi:hypothetical protein F9L00_12670 [Brucella anthropi]|uniref:hypothetical protein n=1 Tax=Brucella/Ochrobactrum group TaxID=2826938 RepID=UPI00124E2BE9|nr:MULTISPECIES: hypothetical protein [Brucella/Ochrobactrum group]KAB2761734.1 hypothetical protein F9K98_15565 [Brucella anthropi]KAB2777576.1 hypothetical protein F9L00_12670 [Brucella anthropi]MCQ9145117.1 hypothetical protein [Ochrobactrum sp. BTU2]UGQ23243.1 hypothetical protein LRL11_22385 [Brucella anthropi]
MAVVSRYRCSGGRVCITTLIVAFRVLSRSIKDGDDALHSRINQVRDEYIRRIEFDMHFNRICDDLRDTRDELKETNKRLDGIMTVLMQEK